MRKPSSLKTYQSIKIGFGTIKGNSGVILVFFLVNLFFSLTLAIPMFRNLEESFGTSYTGKNMAESFDYLWWEQSRYSQEGIMGTFSPSIAGKGAILENVENVLEMRFFSFPPELLALLLLFLLTRTYLTAGAISQLCERPQRFSLSSLLQRSGAYFLPFVLLMLSSWILFYLVGGPLRGALSALVNGVSTRAYSERPAFWLGLLSGAAVLVLLVVVQTIFDYARIQTVLNKGKDVGTAFLKGLMFCFMHLGSVLAITFTFLFLNLVLTVVYIMITERLPQDAIGWISAAFIVQEIFISLIIFLRFWLYSSQISLLRSSPIEAQPRELN